MDMEKMAKETMRDCNREEVSIETPVCVLYAGNFIFGHVTSIKEGKATVKPDIGYNTTKPNFRLKKEYIATSDMIGIINDVIVNEECKEVIV